MARFRVRLWHLVPRHLIHAVAVHKVPLPRLVRTIAPRITNINNYTMVAGSQHAIYWADPWSTHVTSAFADGTITEFAIKATGTNMIRGLDITVDGEVVVFFTEEIEFYQPRSGLLVVAWPKWHEHMPWFTGPFAANETHVAFVCQNLAATMFLMAMDVHTGLWTLVRKGPFSSSNKLSLTATEVRLCSRNQRPLVAPQVFVMDVNVVPFRVRCFACDDHGMNHGANHGMDREFVLAEPLPRHPPCSLAAVDGILFIGLKSTVWAFRSADGALLGQWFELHRNAGYLQGLVAARPHHILAWDASGRIYLVTTEGPR